MQGMERDGDGERRAAVAARRGVLRLRRDVPRVFGCSAGPVAGSKVRFWKGFRVYNVDIITVLTSSCATPASKTTGVVLVQSLQARQFFPTLSYIYNCFCAFFHLYFAV